MPARYQPSPAERVASRPCCKSRGVNAIGTNVRGTTISIRISTTGATIVGGATLAVIAAAPTASLRMIAAWRRVRDWNLDWSQECQLLAAYSPWTRDI